MTTIESNPKTESQSRSLLCIACERPRSTSARSLAADSGCRLLSAFVLLRSSFLPLTLVLFLVPALLRAADTNTVLNAWIAAQVNFTTWSADFVQTRWFKALSQPLVSTGHVWFAKPNRFRWELGSPAQTIAVRNDQQLQIIYPRLKRVEQYPLGAKLGPMNEALGLLDAGFPLDRADFDRRFRVLSLQTTNDAWLIELQPASASVRRMMPAIRVTLAATNFTLLANELEFPDGSRMRSDFRQASLNAIAPADIFRPAVPTDFTITKPLSP